MRKVIHWFRRDLRLNDNTALYNASKEAEQIIPVYILSTWKRTHPWTGPNRQAFLCDCLRSLADDLRRAGGQLIIKAGEPVTQLMQLIQETRAEAIYFNRSYDPYGKEIEAKLASSAVDSGAKTIGFKDNMVFEPDEILTDEGKPFRVFSPYARAWNRNVRPPVLPATIKFNTPSGLESLPLPTLDFWELQKEAQIVPGSESAAKARLRNFLNAAAKRYHSKRNFPDGQSTSRLSQDLRLGTISARQIIAACETELALGHEADSKSVRAFINEIIWRDFYMQILAHYPSVLERDFNEDFAELLWDHNPAAFEAWRQGQTGFPIVDAGMRELQATGFMHNRVRMIVAMFLTKDLHIHWKEGEKYFMQKLVDGDIASNNGGWQWSAGTGADAAPYFRIQNPWTQTRNYDPEGVYIKTWLPELRDVDPEKFIAPQADPLTKNYPSPMLDHAKEREVTLARFTAARRSKT